MMVDCDGKLHPQALEGIHLFNAGDFFEAHEALETAWRDEKGDIRNLYQGILQVAVCFLHITRGNYDGAVKVYGRSMRWLNDLPDVCRGVRVAKLRNDADAVMNELKKLGRERINEFDPSLFKPVVWSEKREWICDRCGTRMHEKNCKVTCPNCGNRFDCSDLNIYFD
ncbi:MAG: DUF309 domain-containing protein [Chloroflexi bacterium]|nr:DUF309 domain-containing protein [Chloroflexota bacterium]